MNRRAASFVAAVVTLLGVASTAVANEGGLSLFIRGDSDNTVVVTPRLAVRGVFNEERTSVNAAYAADVWTSASVDIRTAASRPAGTRGVANSYRWITEQRDQLDLSASHQIDDVLIGASYYYSGENDYSSHGFTLRSTQEVFGKSTTFEESFRYVHDIVGRSGDPTFARNLDSGTARASLTQILSPNAILQAVWDGTYRIGYQSSPYRFVGLGGGNASCVDSLLCVPESHPEVRIRNAFVLRARYAFTNERGVESSSSAGLEYRFYVDDWGIYSHTAVAQIAWVPARRQTLTLRYRFYTQTAAGFYQSSYNPPPGAQIRYVTRDRELSPMFSNRIAGSYEGIAHLAEGVELRIAFALGGTVFVYSDFQVGDPIYGLDTVYAVDGTLSFTLEL